MGQVSLGRWREAREKGLARQETKYRDDGLNFRKAGATGGMKYGRQSHMTVMRI